MAPTIPTAPVVGTPAAPLPADQSLWDRISTWVSEHKAVVYTIAGVAVVVTTAGAVYYIRNSPSVGPCSTRHCFAPARTSQTRTDAPAPALPAAAQGYNTQTQQEGEAKTEASRAGSRGRESVRDRIRIRLCICKAGGAFRSRSQGGHGRGRRRTARGRRVYSPTALPRTAQGIRPEAEGGRQQGIWR
jgi:hypothetical protein